MVMRSDSQFAQSTRLAELDEKVDSNVWNALPSLEFSAILFHGSAFYLLPIREQIVNEIFRSSNTFCLLFFLFVTYKWQYYYDCFLTISMCKDRTDLDPFLKFLDLDCCWICMVSFFLLVIVFLFLVSFFSICYLLNNPARGSLIFPRFFHVMHSVFEFDGDLGIMWMFCYPGADAGWATLRGQCGRQPGRLA